MPPARRWCRCAFVGKLLRDRSGAEPLARVQVEHALHDRCLHRIRDEQALLVREQVAEGWPAAEPAAFFGAAFDAGAYAVDDRGVLELGEHRQHLQHHPAGCRAGIERLRRGLQDDVERVQLLGQLCELAHLAAQPVDAVDEQQVDRAAFTELERRLQTRAVELRAGRLVLLVRDDPPSLLCLAEGLQPFALRMQRGRLVLLVGRDPCVEANPG
jgi:hypothetical protein